MMNNLSKGQRGQAVADLQKNLNAAFGAKLATDGVFGPKTEAAVKHAQNYFGFAKTGIATEVLMHKIMCKLPPVLPAKLNPIEQMVKETLLSKGFTKTATAAVMGVVGGESAFKMFKETSYRNTDNRRIKSIFSKTKKLSDEALNKLKSDDKAFFDFVYGGMYGNAPDEGYKYVGRGFNGITFKANYQVAATATGIDFVGQPELMEVPENAALALANYFKSVKDMTELEPTFKEAYRINAGIGHTFEFYAKSTNAAHVDGIPRKRAKASYYNGLI
jgi:predicted chitinase